MADEQGAKRPKTGGRQAGTPNKATAELKAFLERVFSRAFTEKAQLIRRDRSGTILEQREVSFEDMLVERIITLTIDAKVLNRLLEYHAGAPAKKIDVKGKLTLEQLVAGVVPDDEDDEAGQE